MINVLALDPIDEAGLALLRAREGVALTHLPDPSAGAISAAMADTHVLLVRGRTVPAADFEAAKDLCLVSRHGVGCDNLDLPRLAARGVGVLVAADANYVSVAEHAFAMMLSAAKNLAGANAAVREDDFGRRQNLGARDILGATVLVVGFGRIGRAFTERAKAFGAKIEVHDPFVETPPEGVAWRDNLADALGDADFVTIHAPRTEATDALFDDAMLSACKPGAVLINTARGGIVDEAAMARALDAGRPGVYATDVFVNEPPEAANPLIGRADVILSPHSAAMTREGVRRMATRSARNILDALDGRLDPAMVVTAPRRPLPSAP